MGNDDDDGLSWVGLIVMSILAPMAANKPGALPGLVDKNLRSR